MPLKSPQQLVQEVFDRWSTLVTPAWGQGLFSPTSEQFAEMAAEAVEADRAQRRVPDPDPVKDQGLIRDSLEEFAVRQMEAIGLDLSCGEAPLKKLGAGEKSLDTDETIRMVQQVLRNYAKEVLG